jgi:hypothetical protein
MCQQHTKAIERSCESTEFRVQNYTTSHQPFFFKGLGSRQSHTIQEGNEESNSHSLLRQHYLILILVPTLIKYHSTHLALANRRAQRNLTHGMPQTFSQSSVFVGLKRVVCYPGCLNFKLPVPTGLVQDLLVFSFCGCHWPQFLQPSNIISSKSLQQQPKPHSVTLKKAALS